MPVPKLLTNFGVRCNNIIHPSITKFSSRNTLPARSFYTVERKAIINKSEDYIAKHLHQKILAKGPITIADYMKEVLTSPMQGYYMTKDVFGDQGDFITSPEITQIFGEMIAVWLLNELHKYGTPKPLQIIELGPGRGTLSSDILKVFSKFKALHNTSLHLVEISQVLSNIQAKMLCSQNNLCNPDSLFYRRGTAHQGIPVYWHKQLQDVPAGSFALIIAHEFFDALPIHKFHKTYSGYKEVLVDVDLKNENEFKFRYVLSREDTPMAKTLIKPTETREHIEISPDALLVSEQVCERVKMYGGVALICDYGHDGTGTDTFRAFKKHKQVDPLELPGAADLTADVDFSRIREIAEKQSGIIFLGPTTQRNFLLRVGIDYRYKSLKDNMKDKADIENLENCYNFLLSEKHMGDRFKFCAMIPSTVKKIIEKFPVAGFT